MRQCLIAVALVIFLASAASATPLPFRKTEASDPATSVVIVASAFQPKKVTQPFEGDSVVIVDWSAHRVRKHTEEPSILDFFWWLRDQLKRGFGRL
jgi:hypothetical protein